MFKGVKIISGLQFVKFPPSWHRVQLAFCVHAFCLASLTFCCSLANYQEQAVCRLTASRVLEIVSVCERQLIIKETLKGFVCLFTCFSLRWRYDASYVNCTNPASFYTSLDPCTILLSIPPRVLVFFDTFAFLFYAMFSLWQNVRISVSDIRRAVVRYLKYLGVSDL